MSAYMKVTYTIIYTLIYLIVVAVFTGFLTYIERRIAARMQSRVGPNRVGKQGLLQWIADGIKAIQKEDIIAYGINRPLFKIAPYLVFVGVFATWAAIPISATWVMARLDVGVLYVMAVLTLVVVGIVLAGWSSNNKWSLLGGMRSAAHLLSYEVPTAISLLVIVLLAGTLDLVKIVEKQSANPLDWYMFRNPFAYISFFIFFTSALAEGNRVPFDIPEAESEIIAGYNTEYSGMRFVFFFFAEWANLFVISAMTTILFFGGWNFPYSYYISFTLPFTEKAISFDIISPIYFFIKMNIFVFIIIWVRWTLPRLRIDQLMGLCWKYFVPIGIILIVGEVIWMYYVKDGSTIDYITRTSLLTITILGILYFFYRVYKNLKEVNAKIYLNPFV
jgi:NADH-quinone oxidoreductase subunit H